MNWNWLYMSNNAHAFDDSRKPRNVKSSPTVTASFNKAFSASSEQLQDL